MSSSPAGSEPQPTPVASPTTDPVIATSPPTTTTTTTTTLEPSIAMSSPYQTPSDPPVVTTTDPVVTTIDPVTTTPSPPVTTTKEPTGPIATTANPPTRTTQRPPDPTKDPIVTTVYTTRYITTMSVVTITTRVPHTTIIAGSVTTVYSIETTTTLVPTIIPDPSQPPPPAMFDIVPAGNNRGLRGWQLSLIIVAGFIFIGACASMFLVSWIRKKKLGTCAKDCGSAGSLMPVHLEPWNDPATAAAVMGPPRKGGNGGGWRDYEKEDGLADAGGDHLSPAGAGGAGTLVLTGYDGEQDQQQQRQQRFAEDSLYAAHGQDPGSGSERGADFYYDLHAAVAAAGAAAYPPPPNTLHQLHPPQHPQYVYGNNPQESPTDPLHPSLFRDEDNTELMMHDSSSQPQHQEPQQNYYQQQLQQQQEPISRPIALYSSPLMHLQTMGSPAYSNAYTNSSQSPLTSVPLDGRNEADYADGYGYGYYASGMTPLQSREQPLAVDPSAQDGKTEHPLVERHSKVELRRKSPQALLMVLDRNNNNTGDYSSTETDTQPTGEGEEGQQSSGDVSIKGGVVEGGVGGVGVAGGVGGGVGNGENIVMGDAAKEEVRSSLTASASASASLSRVIKEGHGRDISSASAATSGEGGSSISGGSEVKARRYLDQLRVDTAP